MFASCSIALNHHLCPFSLSVQGAIIIHEVYEEGAASKDGRLWAGDQILEVRRDTESITHYATKVANLWLTDDIKKKQQGFALCSTPCLVR